MADQEEIVAVETVSSQAVAEMIVNILQKEGIPAYLDGTLLQDEFAVAQKVLGNVSVTIQVPRGRLEDARKLLEKLRQDGQRLDEEATDE